MNLRHLAAALACVCLVPAALAAQQPDTTKPAAPRADTAPAAAPRAPAAPGAAAQAVAQEPMDTATLREIVVTATRLPVPLASATSAVTVITGAELERRGIATVGEALRSVPGADVVATGPFGGTTSLFLRGGESDYVRVLVDGVPLNAPGGAVDLATLSTADVARIEVVRGPASVLYGSDAVSGVVQVFTRAGGGPARWEASGQGGTFGERSWRAALAGGGGDGRGRRRRRGRRHQARGPPPAGGSVGRGSRTRACTPSTTRIATTW